jgi:hypothetical protein
MSVRPIISVALLLGLLAGIGCEEDPISTPTAVASPTLATFPLGIGSEWTYRKTDSLTATVTTVTVTVDQLLPSIPSVTAYQWLIDDGAAVDTLVVSIEGDSLTISGTGADAFFGRYVFPFLVGDEWEGLSVLDSVRVVSRGALQTFSLDFDNAFTVVREYEAPNQLNTITHWFVPNVGLAQLSSREFFFGITRNETWELTAYRVL